MVSKTASVTVSASKKKVFNYLSNVENLPRWATEFCLELKVIAGKHKVVTPMGEMYFKISADEKSGVIDIFTGPTEEQMGIFPVRVLELPGGLTSCLFTFYQPPNLSDEDFQNQFESLNRELENVKNQLS